MTSVSGVRPGQLAFLPPASDPNSASVSPQRVAQATVPLGASRGTGLRRWDADGYVDKMLSDLHRSIALLRTLPPAVAFFGGARIKPDDPFFVFSKEVGRLLAQRRIPPRTGGGPGIMESVPQGFGVGLAQLRKAGKLEPSSIPVMEGRIRGRSDRAISAKRMSCSTSPTVCASCWKPGRFRYG